MSLATPLPLERLCELTKVSRAGFYRWRNAPLTIEGLDQSGQPSIKIDEPYRAVVPSGQAVAKHLCGSPNVDHGAKLHLGFG